MSHNPLYRNENGRSVEPDDLMAEPSFKSLHLEMMFGETVLAHGTGFTVPTARGRVLVTARHNVTGRDQQTGEPLANHGGVPDRLCVNAFLSGDDVFARSRQVVPLVDDGGEKLWMEHPDLGSAADFVAVDLPSTPEAAFNDYLLWRPEPDLEVTAGEVVSVVGFPYADLRNAKFPIWATGFMASDYALDFDGEPKFLIDCRARRGQSGSPVIAHRKAGDTVAVERSALGCRPLVLQSPITRFLGIYSGRINSESDIGVVWRKSAIIDLLKTLTATER